MRCSTKRNFIITGGLFALFAIFTVATRLFDVKAIGPEGSSVGFSSINQFIFNLFGVNLIWYNITDWLGVASILVAFGFAILGMIQLVKRRSILKVDFKIRLLGAWYVLVAGVYILFEVCIINYRPIIINTSLEVSYPSSHTMIVVCIMVTAMMMFKEFFNNRKTVLKIANISSVLIIAVTVIGRLISGVHWFTDIVAGVIISAALIMLYYSVVKFIEDEKFLS